MNITLEKIEVKNFKKYAEATFDFNNKDTIISGKNGYGKSSILNAFLWCLLGKDADGKTDTTAIRTIGQPVEVMPEVTVTLMVDGERTVFLRRLQPTYSGKGLDKTYKGDATYCSIDGVPKNAGEYADYIASIFPVDPMIWIDLLSFADDNKFNADERRKVLVDAFGQIDDNEIKALKWEYDELFEKKGKLSVDDFKTSLKQTEKDCTAALGRGRTQGLLASRIDEASRAIQHPELNEETITKEIEELNQRISDTLSASAMNETGYDKLKALRTELDAVEAEIQKDAYESKYKKEIELRDAKNKLTKGLLEIDEQKQRIANVRATQTNFKQTANNNIANVKKELEELNALQPNVTTVCPTCGQPLPKEQIEDAMANFNERKSIEIEKKANFLKALENAVADAEQELSKCDAYEKDVESKESAIKSELSSVENMLSLAVAETYPVPAELASKKCKLTAEVKALEEQINISGNREQTKQAVEELQAQLRTKQAELSEAQGNAKQRERINQLKEEQATTARTLSETQRLIAICDDFIVARAKYIEQSISKHFDGVSFELFSFFKNGELRNSCVPIMDSKPYRLLSFSQKILASVAIINGLAKHYNFNAPMFIDNCSEMDSESLSKLKTDSQKIIIKVSDGDFAVTNS